MMTSDMTSEITTRRTPAWFWAAASLGLLWNAYGVYQFLDSFSQTKASLMAIGMTAAQADLYASLPVWISVVFAVGVFGGLLGSIALLLRSRLALPVLGVSLAGYILLFAGDTYYGVFASIPSQLVILAVVVAIAAGMLWLARFAAHRNLLA